MSLTAYLRQQGIKYLRSGWTYQRLLRQLQQSQWYDAQTLMLHQNEKLRRMVRHCYAHVPYYRDLFRQLGLTPEDIQTRQDLRKLPFLDKYIVRDQFDKFLSRKGIRQLAFPGYTSGSTGTPCKFLRDYHFVNFENAAVWRYYMTHGYQMGMRRLVMTGRLIVPPGQNKPPFWIYDQGMNALIMSSLHLSPANAAAYRDEILKFRPEVIAGYPSAIALLAELLDEPLGDLNISVVFPGSETVLDGQRDRIERVFNAHMFDWYGQQERVAAISQCEYKTYHIQEDYSIVELVDGDGQLEVVGTHTENYKMPLLRYRTGDTVLPDTCQRRCPCGRQFRTVERVLGRSGHGIVTPDGRRITVVTYLMQQFERVREAQFVQEGPDQLTLRLVVEPDFQPEHVQRILAVSRDYISDAMTIRLDLVNTIPRTREGKLLSVLNMWENAASSSDPEEADGECVS